MDVVKALLIPRDLVLWGLLVGAIKMLVVRARFQQWRNERVA